jgi:hypothetical protein
MFEEIEANDPVFENIHAGQAVQIEYADGRSGKLIVADVTEDSILSEDGTAWPRSGIHRMDVWVNLRSDSKDCSSLSSWRTPKCWWTSAH